MKPRHKYFYSPNILSNHNDGMQDWVAACVVERKNGASEDEVRRLVKRLQRMAPALAGALSSAGDPAVPDRAETFEQTLQALRAPAHG